MEKNKDIIKLSKFLDEISETETKFEDFKSLIIDYFRENYMRDTDDIDSIIESFGM